MILRKLALGNFAVLYKVTDPEPDYIVGRSEDGEIITNYAENLDRVIYRGP